MDDKTHIQELKDEILDFVKARDWEQFHNPKDVSLALVIEVSEILEHFRWKTNDEVLELLNDDSKKKELSHEVADSFYLLLRLASVCNIDLTSSLREKIKIINERYPIEKVKGKAHKYTHYQDSNK